jgi:hypothetical protein
MPRHSPTYQAPNQIRLFSASGLVRSAIALAVIVWGSAAAVTQSAAQDTEVAFVAAVTGRVVALSGGTPVLLDTLDPVKDRTRLDLQPNSELLICHYGTQRLYSLKGPSRASVSAGSIITIGAGKPLDLSNVPCTAPVVSNHSGGLVARGIGANEDTGLRRNFFGK